MDEIVKAALRKWPHVPDCRGWLALDARGDWYMRDDRTQAMGPFPRAKGSRILHDKLREFIARNYEADADGCWYFQNGPQRVYVELECAPLVLGVQRLAGVEPANWPVQSHTGELVGRLGPSWVDEHGRLYLETARGLGLMRSADMDAAADAVLAGVWTPEPVEAATLPARHGFCLSPQAAAP
jgi:hypothetical protein